MTHIAITFNQGSVVIYCGGVSKGTGTIGTAGSARLFRGTTLPQLIIGSSTNGFSGTIDELRISQIVRWTSGFTPSTSAYTAD
jgi:hypothetical protein